MKYSSTRLVRPSTRERGKESREAWRRGRIRRGQCPVADRPRRARQGLSGRGGRRGARYAVNGSAIVRRGWGFCFGPGDCGADDLLDLRLQMRRTGPQKSCPYPLQPPIEDFFRRAGTPRPPLRPRRGAGPQGPLRPCAPPELSLSPGETRRRGASWDLLLDQAPQIAQIGNRPPTPKPSPPAPAFSHNFRVTS